MLRTKEVAPCTNDVALRAKEVVLRTNIKGKTKMNDNTQFTALAEYYDRLNSADYKGYADYNTIRT